MARDNHQSVLPNPITRENYGVTILVGEDDANDRFLLEYACRLAGIHCQLVLVHDGVEVVRYLKGEPPYNDRNRYPVPQLLVLDLKMPRMDGFGVLAWMAKQSEFVHLPRVVLSSSGEEQDMKQAEELGVVGYYVKPANFKDLVPILRDLYECWLKPSCGISNDRS